MLFKYNINTYLWVLCELYSRTHQNLNAAYVRQDDAYFIRGTMHMSKHL